MVLQLRVKLLNSLYLTPFVSVVSDTRGGKNKTGGPEDDLENVPPINQSVAMAIAGNPFNTLGRNVLVSMASMVKFLCNFVIVNIIMIMIIVWCFNAFRFKSACVHVCVCVSCFLTGELHWDRLINCQRHTHTPSILKKKITHTHTFLHTSVGNGLWAGIAIISEQGRPTWQTHPSSVATATTQALKLNSAILFLFLFLCLFSRHESLSCILRLWMLLWKNWFTKKRAISPLSVSSPNTAACS